MEVARIHDERRQSLTVIPIAVDIDSPVPTLLSALMNAYSGLYIDVDDDDGLPLDKPTTTDTPPMALRTVLETYLSAAGLLRQKLVISQTGGSWDANFEHLPSKAAGSTGEQRILGLARALLHPDLPRSELAVVAYSDGALSKDERKRAWSLVDGLEGVAHGGLRTLILLVKTEAPIRVDLYCNDRGFRFAHADGRLLVRHSRERTDFQINQLARTSDRLAFYIGAGFSASSNLPMGNSLRDTVLRGLGPAAGVPTTSQGLASWFRASSGSLTAAEEAMDEETFAQTLTLERVIPTERAMNDGNSPTLADFQERVREVVAQPPSDAVRFLHDAIRSGMRAVIVTVNLDTLIENDMLDYVTVFATEDEFDGAASYVERYWAGTERKMPVLKIHGTIEDLSSCVVTLQQTQVGLSPAKKSAIEAILDETVLTRWIYVGASMRDADFNMDTKHSAFAERVSEHWVAPMIESTVESFARDREFFWDKLAHKDDRFDGFRHLQDRAITETADIFMAKFSREIVSGGGS